MSRAREADLRVHGQGLVTRFALAMTAALSLVMAIAGFTLYRSSTNIAQRVFDDQLSRAVRQMQPESAALRGRIEDLEKAIGDSDDLESANLRSLVRDLRRGLDRVHILPPFEQASTTARRKTDDFGIYHVRYGEGMATEGELYRYTPDERNVSQILVPSPRQTTGQLMLRLIVSLMLIIVLVGAGIAMWVARQVSQPIHELVDDVRQIAKGNLQHRIRARGVGEVELLARAIDRMTRDLEGARDAELELSVRKREVELASGVREALLPLVTPELPGYDVGGAQLVSDEMGGDLFDYVELSGGRLGLLVCDVSGRGLPAALIGATARSYLRSELRQGEDVKAALCRVNRELVQDVRRGMFVTALYAVVDPRSHEVDVYCAGHKLPLLRYVAAERKLRLVHPEGIALGFDQGPVFERSIEVQRFRLEPGDRLLLANTAPVRLAGGAGTELGEKGFYQLVLRNSAQPTPQFLKSLRKGLEEACGGERFPADISLVTILREG